MTELGQMMDRDHNQVPAPHDMYWDLDDRPCTFGRWCELFQSRKQWLGPPEPMPLYIIGRETRELVEVSTVWIGHNHAFFPGRPQVYETMVFGGPRDQDLERYATRAEAEAGHARWVKEIFG